MKTVLAVMGIERALVLRRLLPARQWRLVAHAGMEEALAALRRTNCDAVLLGPAALNATVVGSIVSAAQEIPVLALSPDDETGLDVMRHGVDDYQLWPTLERGALLNAMRKAALRVDARCGNCALAEAFAHAPVAVALADPEFGIQWTNTAFALFHDVGHEPTRQRSLLSFFPAETLGALGSRESWTGVWRSPSSSARWERGELTPIEGGEGRVTGYVAVKQDVTELEQTTQALRHQEESHRRLMTHAPSVIYRASGEWWVETLSKHIEVLTGYSADEFTRGLVRWPDVVHPEDCERVLTEATRLNEGLTELTQEYRLLHRDGSSVWVQDRKEAVLDERGDFAFVRGVVQDIDARKRAELALERQTLFLRTLIDAIPSPLFFKDRQRRFMGCNKAFERLVGVRSEEIEGQRSEDLWPTRQAPEIRRVDEELLRRRGTIIYDSRIDDELRAHLPHLPDEVRDLTYLKSTFEGEGGEVGGLIAIIVDSSEKLRQAEESRLAKDEAERSVERKATLLANASHEIRTPLNAVIGMSQLLASSTLNDEQQRWAHRIAEAGEGLLHLLHDLLDIARLESGTVSIQRIPFPLIETIESVVELMRAQARAASLRLRLELDPALPPRMLGDPRRLRQVLTNLLSNALKFTQEGEIAVVARSVEDSVGASWLHLAVRDSGVGMAPDEVHALFERFQRGDAAKEAAVEGTGLGLAISQQLVAQMGGRIEVHTSPGAGSIFVVLLPLASPTLSVGTPPARKASEPASSTLHREHQLRELARLVREHDTEALDRIDDFLASGPPPAQRRTLEKVERCLRRYDFPEAAQALEPMLLVTAPEGGG